MPFNIERIGDFFNREVLKYPENNAIKKSAVLDSSATLTAFTTTGGRIVVPSGTVLVVSGSDTDEVQTIELHGSPTGGTFKLKWNDAETAAIKYNATKEELEEAIEALANLETADVKVGGAAGKWTVTFEGAYSGSQVSNFVVSDNSLTGGSDPYVTVVETTTALAEKVKPAGESGVEKAQVVGVLAYTVELFGTGASKYDEPCAVWFRDVVFDRQKLIMFSGNAAEVAAALPTCGFEV